jgi:hypothetical protein
MKILEIVLIFLINSWKENNVPKQTWEEADIQKSSTTIKELKSAVYNLPRAFMPGNWKHILMQKVVHKCS